MAKELNMFILWDCFTVAPAMIGLLNVIRKLYSTMKCGGDSMWGLVSSVESTQMM